jgi:hypothetical protein
MIKVAESFDQIAQRCLIELFDFDELYHQKVQTLFMS